MNNYHLRQRIKDVLLDANKLNPTPRAPAQPEEGASGDPYSRGYDVVKIGDQYNARIGEENKFSAQNTQILAGPHQFLATADWRIDENNRFGYNFARDIFLERPIVTLMPGKVNYLPDFAEDDKKTFKALIDGGAMDGDKKTTLEALIGDHEDTRYYDFQTDYASYIKQVNMLCRLCAIYLGLDGKDDLGPDGKTPYKQYNWANYQQLASYSVEQGSELYHKGFFQEEAADDQKPSAVERLKALGKDITQGKKMYVNFYMDPSSSVNESFTNTTQKSQLEGAFDSMEAQVKEVAMLAASSGSGAMNSVSQFAQSFGEKILDIGNTMTLGLFKNMLQTGGKQVINGANLIYPEIWMDSDYSKSYSIQINLVSPYGSKEAIYLNCIVPLMHILGFALPKQTTANSYAAPYIIRGFSTGRFSIDLGIVESLTIDKGPDETFSVVGLPTQIKVTMNIKDLYSALMLTPVTKSAMFFSNQGMLDYLGSLCGVDLTLPNVVFKYNVMRAIVQNATLGNLSQNVYMKMRDALYNATSNLMR